MRLRRFTPLLFLFFTTVCLYAQSNPFADPASVTDPAEDGSSENASSSPQQPPAPAAAPSASAFAPIKLGNVTFSGTLRLRLYDWDWFVPKSGNNSYLYTGNLLRFGFSQDRDSWDWKAEFAVPFLLGLPNNATVAAPQGALGLGGNYVSANSGSRNTAMIFPKQLYIRFDQLGGSSANKLQIGRFEFFDGAEVTSKNATVANLKRNHIEQRLIGNFGFTDVQRSFDGLNYSFNKGSSNLTLQPESRRAACFRWMDGAGIALASATWDTPIRTVTDGKQVRHVSLPSITTIGVTFSRRTTGLWQLGRAIWRIFISRPGAVTPCRPSRPKPVPSIRSSGALLKPGTGATKNSAPDNRRRSRPSAEDPPLG